jgi:hypothetical protein
MRHQLFHTEFSWRDVIHSFEIWLVTSLAIGISSQPSDCLFRDSLVFHLLFVEIRIDREMPEHQTAIQNESFWGKLIALWSGGFVGTRKTYFRTQEDLEHYAWLLRTHGYLMVKVNEDPEDGPMYEENNEQFYGEQ